jgi:hypothetical protein
MNEKPEHAGKSYRMVGNPAAKRHRRRPIRFYARIALVIIAAALLAWLAIYAYLQDWTIPHRS